MLLLEIQPLSDTTILHTQLHLYYIFCIWALPEHWVSDWDGGRGGRDRKSVV